MTRRVAAAITGLIALLLVVLALTAGTAPVSDGLVFSYSSTDAGAGGTLALRRWLSSLGYETRSVQGRRFTVPPDVSLLFVLGPSPQEIVPEDDARTLREWVSRGGTLVLGSDRSFVDEALFKAFGAVLEDRSPGAIAGEISPALSRPVLRDLSTNTARALRFAEPAAMLVGDGERAIVARRDIGQGRVFVTSAPDMFVNANLAAAQNDRLVLNLLAGLTGPVVAFDEYHHGARIEPDPLGLFTGTAAGRAALVAGALVFLYIAFRGRRFGTALPIEERPARSSLEYIRSFAGLLRRSRATPLAGERLARRYRRRLARALGMRATSEADDVLAGLARSDPRRAADLDAVFARLGQARADNDLLAAAARAESALGEIERR